MELLRAVGHALQVNPMTLSGHPCFELNTLLLRIAGDASDDVLPKHRIYIPDSCFSACTVHPAQGPARRSATMGKRRPSIP